MTKPIPGSIIARSTASDVNPLLVAKFKTGPIVKRMALQGMSRIKRGLILNYGHPHIKLRDPGAQSLQSVAKKHRRKYFQKEQIRLIDQAKSV